MKLNIKRMEMKTEMGIGISMTMGRIGVNLAHPTRLGPGPCGLGPKKPILKKSPY